MKARLERSRRQRLLRDVGLVLPDGVRGDCGVGSIGCDSGADKAASVLPVHAGADGVHLPDSRGLDVGRGLAGTGGILRLCRFDDSTQHGRLGGDGRDNAGGPEAGQVPKGRERQADSALQRTAGDAGRVHPVAGLVRVQRRVSAGPRERAGRRGDECSAGEHEPGSSGGGCNGPGRFEADPGSDRPLCGS